MTLPEDTIECAGCGGDMSVFDIGHFPKGPDGPLYCCEWCEVRNVLMIEWRKKAVAAIRKAIKEVC